MIFEYSCMYGTIKVVGSKMSYLSSSSDYNKFRLAIITGISNGFDVIKDGDFVIGKYGDLEFEISGNVSYLLDLFSSVIGGLPLCSVTQKKMDDELFYRRVRSGF